MFHRSHEPFFSFTVPPKLSHNGLPQFPSTPSHQSTDLFPSFINNHHPNLNLEPSSRSPPTLHRPNTAGQFAFNVPSITPTSTPSSVQLSTSTSASSIPTSIDRPYSSSGLPAFSDFPQTVSHSQTYASNYVARPQHNFKSPIRTSFSNLDSHSHLSTLANGSRYAIPNQYPRPMTAPGPDFKERLDQGNEAEFFLDHAELLREMSSYPHQPTNLPEISQISATSQVESTNPNHLIHSSPGSSSKLIEFEVTTGQASHESSTGSSNPDSRLHGCTTAEVAGNFAHPKRESPHRLSGSGRPSLATCSSGSPPESPESPDGHLSHSRSHLSTPSDRSYRLLRPSTHSGAPSSFDEERNIAQSLSPRPATGYLNYHEALSTYAPIHSQYLEYSQRLPVYSAPNSQIYASNPGNYACGPGSTELNSHDRLYNFNILPNAPRKRARRRFDEVERLYCCNFPGCTKAYGTLNHLNAHVSMQKHGSKRLPQEFEEIRKQWRARRKNESAARSVTKHSTANVNVYGAQDALLRSHVGLSCNSISSYTLTSPTVVGSYSAPAQFQQFPMMAQPNDWHNDS